MSDVVQDVDRARADVPGGGQDPVRAETDATLAVVRPLASGDIPAAQVVARNALDGVSISLDATPHLGPPVTDEMMARGRARMQRVLDLDPGGAWVATTNGEVAGVCLAIRRSGLWMLSLLAVSGGLQGQGVGRRLLDAGLTTAEGSDKGLIVVSRDPRAMRRYHQAGFALEPAYEAEGTLDRGLIPAGLGVRDGDVAKDEGLCADVATALRGADHGGDLGWLVEHGAQLLVAEDGPRRGFAVARNGLAVVVGATDPGMATRLLWASIATCPEGKDASIEMMTGRQQWAIDVAMAARLPLALTVSVATRGQVGPFTPYLPSGIWG